MERGEIRDLAEELKCVSRNLNLLACVVTEGIGGGGDTLSPQGIEDSIYTACKHLDRIADDLDACR